MGKKAVFGLSASLCLGLFLPLGREELTLGGATRRRGISPLPVARVCHHKVSLGVLRDALLLAQGNFY